MINIACYKKLFNYFCKSETLKQLNDSSHLSHKKPFHGAIWGFSTLNTCILPCNY